MATEVQKARRRVYINQYYRDHPTRYTVYKIKLQCRYYGIKPWQYVETWHAQRGLCGICLDPLGGKAHVDHDHKCCNRARACGKCFRGLLCKRCNAGIGYLRESEFIFQQAIKWVAPKTVQGA